MNIRVYKFLGFFLMGSMICCCNGRLFAQAHQSGMINISAGVGGSLIGSLFDVVTNTSGIDGSNSPVINGMVDYGVTDRLSIGAAISYQSYEIAFDDSQGDYVDDINCLNIGARALIHLFNAEFFDPYLGVRAGLTNWGANSTSTVAGYDPLAAFDLNSVNFQLLLGMSYYFNESAGINFELGTGTYVIAIGAKFKFLP